jgi:hypothetical protein
MRPAERIGAVPPGKPRGNPRPAASRRHACCSPADDGRPEIRLRRYVVREAFMPSKAKYKKSGGDKDFADKNTMNPPSKGGGTQTEETEEHHVNKRVGQFGETGQPPLMKK